ncbi:hypothetical protein FRB95_012877 [Tulasnella sp. JGI-2019a]|nr:hypothetical protein FRB95_012877 [Tulasnella sp. JGI-2019a]
MASLEDASNALGKYLLKGWTMMNDACPVCHTPMMRSPDRTQLICVLNHPQESRAGTAGESSGSKASSNSTISIGGSTSRPSTPPTPLSDSHDSDNFVMPPPSEETLRRRQQSDLASQRIGAKMLQGYAMLAEECLNPDCIGVPLIRPPKPGSKDPHKECVICNNVYVEVLDSRGHASLQLVSPPLPASTDPIQPQSSRSTIAPGPPVEDRSLSGPWHTALGRGTADLKAKHKPFDDIVSRPSANVSLAFGVLFIETLGGHVDLVMHGRPKQLPRTRCSEMFWLLSTNHSVLYLLGLTSCLMLSLLC